MAGCTTTIAFKDLNRDKSPYPGLKDKRLALILEPAKVPEKVSTTTELETFDFVGIKSSIEKGLTDQLLSEAKSVEVYTGQPPEKPFDYYIKPQITVRSVDDFWTFGCLMTYKVEIYDNQLKLIATGTGEAKRNFMFSGQAERKCVDAMAELFDSVNDKALSKTAR